MTQDLADELHRRADADQAARLRRQETREPATSPESTRTPRRDSGPTSPNTAGRPGMSLVGEQGAREAWLLAQHADRDPTFQEKCWSC